jgi:hypothetical protein
MSRSHGLWLSVFVRPAAAEWSGVGAKEKLVSLAALAGLAIGGPTSAVTWRVRLRRLSEPGVFADGHQATGERKSWLLEARGK